MSTDGAGQHSNVACGRNPLTPSFILTIAGIRNNDRNQESLRMDLEILRHRK